MKRIVVLPQAFVAPVQPGPTEYVSTTGDAMPTPILVAGAVAAVYVLYRVFFASDNRPQGD